MCLASVHRADDRHGPYIKVTERGLIRSDPAHPRFDGEHPSTPGGGQDRTRLRRFR